MTGAMTGLYVKPTIESMDFQSREALNTLRGNIQMAGMPLKVISFTSSFPGEGKSTISFQLAKNFAGLSKKTLFLDCDIRNSKIKAKYNISESTHGLSEYLCGLNAMDEIIYHTDDPYMDIIFAGVKAPNPSELLSSKRFEDLISILKKFYDYIIIDTPPINIVVDALLVAQHTDTSVFVVKSCSTDRNLALHGIKQMHQSGANILGVVMNRVSEEKTSYGKYGKYGKYGYGRYGSKKYGCGKYGFGKAKKECEKNYGFAPQNE